MGKKIKLIRIASGVYKTEDSRFYCTRRLARGSYYVTDETMKDTLGSGAAYLVAIVDTLNACKREMKSHLRRQAHPGKKIGA